MQIHIAPNGDRYILQVAADGSQQWVRTLTHPQNRKTAPAVIAFNELREQFGRYFDEIDVDEFMREIR